MDRRREKQICIAKLLVDSRLTTKAIAFETFRAKFEIYLERRLSVFVLNIYARKIGLYIELYNIYWDPIGSESIVGGSFISFSPVLGHMNWES